jgi:hypothetical protein
MSWPKRKRLGPEPCCPICLHHANGSEGVFCGFDQRAWLLFKKRLGRNPRIVDAIEWAAYRARDYRIDLNRRARELAIARL